MARRSPKSSRPVRPSSTPAKRKGIPLTPLAQQMLHDLQLAGKAERTQEAYLRAVRKFAQWLRKSPHLASENDLRRYLTLAPQGPFANEVRTRIADLEGRITVH